MHNGIVSVCISVNVKVCSVRLVVCLDFLMPLADFFTSAISACPTSLSFHRNLKGCLSIPIRTFLPFVKVLLFDSFLLKNWYVSFLGISFLILHQHLFKSKFTQIFYLLAVFYAEWRARRPFTILILKTDSCHTNE